MEDPMPHYRTPMEYRRSRRASVVQAGHKNICNLHQLRESIPPRTDSPRRFIMS